MYFLRTLWAHVAKGEIGSALKDWKILNRNGVQRKERREFWEQIKWWVPSEKAEQEKKKTLAYILRTGYHPLSSAPSSALFPGKNTRLINQRCTKKVSCLFFTFVGNLWTSCATYCTCLKMRGAYFRQEMRLYFCLPTRAHTRRHIFALDTCEHEANMHILTHPAA